MALMQTLIAAVGPLPLSNTFKTEGDGEVIFYLSGSAWSGTENSSISVTLYLDNTAIGTSVAFTNESGSHKTLVPIFIPAKVSYGTHTVTLQIESSVTNTDLNDNFNVVLIY